MSESNQSVRHPGRPRGTDMDLFIKCSAKGLILQRFKLRNTGSVLYIILTTGYIVSIMTRWFVFSRVKIGSVLVVSTVFCPIHINISKTFCVNFIAKCTVSWKNKRPAIRYLWGCDTTEIFSYSRGHYRKFKYNLILDCLMSDY